MSIKSRSLQPDGRGVQVLALAGLLGALAASSCCILPLLLFSLGIGGAWIANFTRLAAYQPVFLAATVAFLGGGYWLVYRASRRACAGDQACARPLPKRFVVVLLVAATIIVIAAFAFDFVAPYLLS
jgi:mercuric ion transport protein